MKRGLYITTILVSILLIGLVSAGLLGDIRNALTGHATSQDTNVTVTVTGTTPVTVGPVDNSSLGPNVNPNESNPTSTTIYTQVCDANGVNDINDSSVTATYFKSGETNRTNSSCVLVGDLDANCANYSCTVVMYYWDGAGIWNISISASDIGNGTTIYNNTAIFQYNLLKAMVISPQQLNWTAITPGDTDAKADNETTVNNTGNYDGTINITGLDLYGLTTTSEKFGVDNFTSGIADDCTGSGVYLANNSQVLVTSSDSNPGNLSAGGGAGQEELFYCIPNVPQLSSQQYSTAQLGSWTISY